MAGRKDVSSSQVDVATYQNRRLELGSQRVSRCFELLTMIQEAIAMASVSQARRLTDEALHELRMVRAELPRS